MKTKNLAVSILVGVLVVALWYTMLLKPTRAKVAKAKTDTTEQEAKLAPLKANLAKAQHDAANAAALQAQLQSLQAAMPNTPALSAFIRDANGIASASGAQWLSVTHQAPVSGADGLMSITVGMQVQGTYGQVLDYVGRLASMKRLFVLDNLQLSTTSSATSGAAASADASTGPFSGGDELSATISGRMFATPAAAAAAAGTTGTGSSTGTGTTPTGSSSAPSGSSSTG
jgi:Tfp pilus assembly protein PilO